MEEKRCPCCKSLKPIKNFGLNKTKKDGHKTYCKKCSSEKDKQYKNNHSEEYKEKRRMYEKKNREKILQRKRLYKINNIEKINKWNALYVKTNKEKILERSRQWTKANPERVRERNRLWKKAHPEKSRLWREKNPEKVRKCELRWKIENREKLLESKKRANKKMRSTLCGRLNSNLAAYISTCLCENKKGRKWESLVNFTVNDLKQHIEKQFKDGMTWENYGRHGWHIDHKIPISVFNFEKPEDDDFKRCWSLDNLQPLWATENLKKQTKLGKHFQPSIIFKDSHG